LADLIDMQCLWFLLAEGDSFRRQGKYNLALKRYHTIEKVCSDNPSRDLSDADHVIQIFSEIHEDEFEFHQYCMRKFTLRACVK